MILCEVVYSCSLSFYQPKGSGARGPQKPRLSPVTLCTSLRPWLLTASPAPAHRRWLTEMPPFLCEQLLVLSLTSKYDSLFKGTRGAQKDLEGFPRSALALQRGEQGGRQKKKNAGHNVLLLRIRQINGT